MYILFSKGGMLHLDVFQWRSEFTNLPATQNLRLLRDKIRRLKKVTVQRQIILSNMTDHERGTAACIVQ